MKDIAQYEENDSILVKYTIMELQVKNNNLKTALDESQEVVISYIEENKELKDRINKAIEYIKEKYNCELFQNKKLLNILKGNKYE